MSTPTPRTDAAWARAFDLPEFSAAHTARTMRDECATLERELAHQHETSRLLRVAMDARDDGYTEMRKLLSKVETALAIERAKVRTLSTACERLRDCDWTITLPDRMDAVRDIARAALAATEDTAPKSDQNAPKLNQTGANRPASPHPS